MTTTVRATPAQLRALHRARTLTPGPQTFTTGATRAVFPGTPNDAWLLVDEMARHAGGLTARERTSLTTLRGRLHNDRYTRTRDAS